MSLLQPFDIVRPKAYKGLRKSTAPGWCEVRPMATPPIASDRVSAITIFRAGCLRSAGPHGLHRGWGGDQGSPGAGYLL